MEKSNSNFISKLCERLLNEKSSSHIEHTLAMKTTRYLCVPLYVCLYNCVWSLIGVCNWVSCSDSSWLQGLWYMSMCTHTTTHKVTINDGNNVNTEPMPVRENESKTIWDRETKKKKGREYLMMWSCFFLSLYTEKQQQEIYKKKEEMNTVDDTHCKKPTILNSWL